MADGAAIGDAGKARRGRAANVASEDLHGDGVARSAALLEGEKQVHRLVRLRGERPPDLPSVSKEGWWPAGQWPKRQAG